LKNPEVAGSKDFQEACNEGLSERGLTRLPSRCCSSLGFNLAQCSYIPRNAILTQRNLAFHKMVKTRVNENNREFKMSRERNRKKKKA